MTEMKEEQEDEQQGEDIRKHIEKVNHCPYCDAVFCGSLKQMEDDRISHIKEEHPEKRLFKIEELDKKTKEEIHYFITVDRCNSGKRGIFCNKQGTGYWKMMPHTEEEMIEVLGHFWIILDPKSEPFTEEQLKNRRWFPLAEYKKEYGISIKKEE